MSRALSQSFGSNVALPSPARSNVCRRHYCAEPVETDDALGLCAEHRAEQMDWRAVVLAAFKQRQEPPRIEDWHRARNSPAY
jgi:hypothetical protein